LKTSGASVSSVKRSRSIRARALPRQLTPTGFGQSDSLIGCSGRSEGFSSSFSQSPSLFLHTASVIGRERV